MTRPEPPSTARTTKSTRIRVASMPKSWARPPHTPASWRLVRLRYNFRVESMAPPSASRTCNQMTVLASLLVAEAVGNRLAAPRREDWWPGSGLAEGRDGRGQGGQRLHVPRERGDDDHVLDPHCGGGLAAAGEVATG